MPLMDTFSYEDSEHALLKVSADHIEPGLWAASSDKTLDQQRVAYA